MLVIIRLHYNYILVKPDFMALVTNLREGFKNRHTIHKQTECSYFVVHDGRNKYLQIDTTGSEDRQMAGKTSQSIQFSPEAIKQLKEILNRL
jgi:hypothetical protein